MVTVLKKTNTPILLVFCRNSLLHHALKTYRIHPLVRFEFEAKSGVILVNLLFSAALKSNLPAPKV
jgi:hypothetical protein